MILLSFCYRQCQGPSSRVCIGASRVSSANNVCVHQKTTTSPQTSFHIPCHKHTIMATTDTPSHVSTLFSSLLEQSRKLRQETENDGLETVQLGLNELERRARDLKKKTKDGQQTDARA